MLMLLLLLMGGTGAVWNLEAHRQQRALHFLGVARRRNIREAGRQRVRPVGQHVLARILRDGRGERHVCLARGAVRQRCLEALPLKAALLSR